eukprot:13621483-Alexandrium_andersonii.AAC.1
MVDPRHHADPSSVAQRFWNDHACNKDDWFSLKLMDIFQNSAELGSDACLKAALLNWGRCAKVTNMHVERMLSRLKRATPAKLPYAERLLAAGAVAEWLHRHAKAGGQNPRTTTRAQLLASGAPLRAKARTG